jgi:uncharacterized protein YndB with AHSA1/START domain
MTGIVATAEIHIDAEPERVWKTLTEPASVKEWMFGTDLETDWKVGGPIVWKGQYEGKSYEDKGEVLVFDAPRRLSVSHFSPMSGQDDKPENYHTLVYTLTPIDRGTHIELTQDNNGSEEEAQHSTANWEQALRGIKAHIEGRAVEP